MRHHSRLNNLNIKIKKVLFKEINYDENINCYIFSDINSLREEELNDLKFLVSKRNTVISIIDWCGFYLKRYPSEFITNNFSITEFGEFRTNLILKILKRLI